MVRKLIDKKVPVRGLIVFYLLSLCLLWSYFVWDYANAAHIFSSPHDRHLFVLGILFVCTGMAMLFLAAIVGVWFFIYHDAAQRGMNQWLWTFIAIFTPNLLGIVIYLILRKPVLTECPGCQARLEPQLLFCPQCGRQFKQKCSACGALVEQGHQFCGSCGANLKAPRNANA
jgi:hypothetical protein